MSSANLYGSLGNWEAECALRKYFFSIKIALHKNETFFAPSKEDDKQALGK